MTGVLLTDLYQLTMLQAYLDEGLNEVAVFELFVRRLPQQRNFLVAAGLEQALDYLQALSFTEPELAWLKENGQFSPHLLEHLRLMRFQGDVDAMPEGTVFFANEPILRVTAPLPQAQLVESRLMNLVHFQTLIASKAARVVMAAPRKQLVDFGMRRAHGAEAALYAARASYLAGFTGTATVEAGRQFGIPLFGTMAHSYIQAHESELAAFEAFARARPNRPTLLVDTYDTEAAVRKLITLVPKLAADGISIASVRLDSGDLALHAKAVRTLLDAAGLELIRIFASGSLDEQCIERLLADGAPIDGFGVGTALDTSIDVPALDSAYKLQAYGGTARRKRSEGKATWPGVKQVYREFDAQGRMVRDRVQLLDEAPAGCALLQPCMRAGQRLQRPPLAQLRTHCAEQLAALPQPLQALTSPTLYPVDISPAIRTLARTLDDKPH